MKSSQIGNILPDVGLRFTNPFESVGSFAKDYASQIRRDEAEAQRQKEWNKEFSLRQAAEDRAKSEYDRQLKDRENRINFASVAADLVPHLQSQDTEAYSQEMGKILQTPISGNPVARSVRSNYGNITVPQAYTQRVQTGTVGDPNTVNTQFKYNVNEPGPYKEGPMTSARLHKTNAIQDQIDSLINTKGMYTSIPASSARDLNKAGLAEKAKLEAQLKEVMRDKSIPPVAKTITTDFNSLNLGTTYTKNGKVAPEGTPFSKMYVRDEKNGKLLSMNTATAIAQKQQQGIDQASVPTYVTKTGYKDVPVSSTKIMQKFSGKGYSEDQVAQVASGVQSQYNEVLKLLPKDNAGKREELRGYLNMIAGNLGIDPKDMDVNAYADKLLPKSEMSEAQKVAVNTIIHGLDQKLNQANKDREFNLQQYSTNANLAIQQAKLGLERLGLQLRQQEAKEAKIPKNYMIDPKYAPAGYITEQEYEAQLKKKARTPEEIRKAQLELEEAEYKAKRREEKRNDYIPFNEE